MVKRDDPFTPQVARGKRAKPYFSPANSPLRSPVVNAANVGSPLVSGLARAAASMSKSGSGLINELTPQKADSALRQKRVTEAMLSPAVEASPKASPFVQKNRRAAALASFGALQSTVSTAPPPLNPPKLTVEQMNKTFEEWMRIAADNVKKRFMFLENQCQELVECGLDRLL